MAESINGVVALLVSSDGEVLGVGTDFNQSGYGGFELHEAQRIRARNDARHDFLRRMVGPRWAKGLNLYPAESFVQEVCRAQDVKERFVIVGHKGAQPYWADFVNRPEEPPRDDRA